MPGFTGVGMKKRAATKPDQLTGPSLPTDVNRIRIEAALWRHDRNMAEAAAVWGHDCLPYYGTDETRAKWWGSIDALWKADQNNDAETFEALVDNLERGLRRLADEATAAGFPKLDPRVMETALPSGGTLCIVQSWPEHAHRPEPRPGVQVYSIEEIARMIDTHFSLVQKTKMLFPDATVVTPKRNSEYLDDEIPF